MYASLTLGAVDRAGRSRTFTVIGLEGTLSYPHSVEMLEPGETATIRDRGVMSMDPEDAERVLAAAQDGLVKVQAGLTIMVRPAVWSETLVSENAVALSLRFAAPVGRSLSTTTNCLTTDY